MELTAQQVAELLSQREALLSECDEYLAARNYAFCVDAWVEAKTLNVPLSLRHPNTQIIEIFNADWSDPDTLTNHILPYLENLCEYWENVHRAHEAALTIFRAAAHGGPGFCLYLRSFSHVMQTAVDAPEGRAVAYLNTEALDRNVAHALAAEATTLNPVSCLHPDDMALLEGRWLLPSFRVHDHDWKPAVSDAIASSKVIVFYLGAQSRGAEFELEEIRRTGLMGRTVLVYESEDNLSDDVAEFAGTFALPEFVGAGDDPLGTRLTKKAKKRLAQLARDRYEPPRPPASLSKLPCNVVDPRVPIKLPANIDPKKTFCITPDNLTAFAWYIVGLPAAMLCWNRIDRRLYEEKCGPDIDELNELLRNVTMACLGATSLGLTASMSGAIGLRVITANLVQVPKPRKRAQRKKAFLRVLDIADRFDDLTSNRFWHARNDQWRSAILEDVYT
jgi:hypothetical protein